MQVMAIVTQDAGAFVPPYKIAGWKCGRKEQGSIKPYARFFLWV